MRRDKPPAARDPRMDRPRGEDLGWSLLVVPKLGGTVRELQFVPFHLYSARFVVVALAVSLAAAVIALVVTVPRSVAYHGLVEENIELKRDLQKVSERMSEVDRLLLRLRLYDAQMKSLSEPRGDFGPVVPSGALPVSKFSNQRLDEGAVEGESGAEELGGEEAWLPAAAPGSVEEELALDDGGDLGVERWAAAVVERADSFLSLFRLAEPDLNRLLDDLEKLRAVEGSMPSRWPTRGMFSSGFGWRRNPFGRREWKFHSGIDLAAPKGTPIYAAAAGEVVVSEFGNSGYGRHVVVDHGYGIATLYGHCSVLFVEPGDHVEPGDLIGTMGSTGRSTGSHLHFEVRLDGNAVDPLDYLPRRRGGR